MLSGHRIQTLELDAGDGTRSFRKVQFAQARAIEMRLRWGGASPDARRVADPQDQQTEKLLLDV